MENTKGMQGDLTELGFSENEAKIYIALLELGQTTTGPLIKKTGLYRVIVYDIIQRLIEKGFVSYVVRKNRKEFSAQDPQYIVEMIQEKQILAKQVAKRLSAIQAQPQLPKGALIYEGWRGIKAAQENYFSIMKKGKEEYVMVGASRTLHKKLDAFFNHFHKRRAALKVGAKLLFNENNRSFAQSKVEYKPIDIKFLPKKMITPSWISMYQDMVLIGVAEDTPMAFFIKNSAVAKSYKQYFASMWDIAR